MKIDTSTINGYAEMSAEDKLKALEAYEFEAPAQKDDGEVTRLKAALSKANSEASEWKKQLREKQTEQERAEAERAESDKAIQEELKALRRDKTVSGYVAQCLALGYDKDLASKAAEAMADGNAAVIFECQQTFLETQKKAYEAAALNKQPSLTAGAPPTASKPEADNKLRAYFGLPPVKTQ